MTIYGAKIPDTVLLCGGAGKTVGAEALELLPVSGCLWIKARWSTNAGSGAAFKDPDTSLAGLGSQIPPGRLVKGRGIVFALRA